MHRLALGLYSHPKEFLGNGVRTHVNCEGKTSSNGKILPRGGWNPQHCLKQDSEPNTLPTEPFGSPKMGFSRGSTALEADAIQPLRRFYETGGSQ